MKGIKVGANTNRQGSLEAVIKANSMLFCDMLFEDKF